MDKNRFFQDMFGSYYKVVVFPSLFTMRFENGNWYEDHPLDSELLIWCKQQGMRIEYKEGK